jgi:hypothetical protein
MVPTSRVTGISQRQETFTDKLARQEIAPQGRANHKAHALVVFPPCGNTCEAAYVPLGDTIDMHFATGVVVGRIRASDCSKTRPS